MNSNNPLYVEALQHFQAAEHLLKVTFPLAKEPKALWGVLANLIRSLELIENIQPVNPLLNQLKELWELHQKCPVEFRHKEQVVLCTEDYQCQFLTEKRVREYLLETESLLRKTAI